MTRGWLSKRRLHTRRGSRAAARAASVADGARMGSHPQDAGVSAAGAQQCVQSASNAVWPRRTVHAQRCATEPRQAAAAAGTHMQPMTAARRTQACVAGFLRCSVQRNEARLHPPRLTVSTVQHRSDMQESTACRRPTGVGMRYGATSGGWRSVSTRSGGCNTAPAAATAAAAATAGCTAAATATGTAGAAANGGAQKCARCSRKRCNRTVRASSATRAHGTATAEPNAARRGMLSAAAGSAMCAEEGVEAEDASERAPSSVASLVAHDSDSEHAPDVCVPKDDSHGEVCVHAAAVAAS
jgi:hypothetical protein